MMSFFLLFTNMLNRYIIGYILPISLFICMQHAYAYEKKRSMETVLEPHVNRVDKALDQKEF